MPPSQTANPPGAPNSAPIPRKKSHGDANNTKSPYTPETPARPAHLAAEKQKPQNQRFSPSSLAMSALHKPGISSSMSPSPSPGGVTYKYAKIQPAIAIKPKPAVGSGGSLGSSKTAFNPRYNPASSPSKTPADEPPAANINTSKKWVLPPRPRPGRKPLSAQGTPTPGTISSDDERKTSCHKKPKVSKAAGTDRVERSAKKSSSFSSPSPSTSAPSTPQSHHLNSCFEGAPMSASSSASSAVTTADTRRLAGTKASSMKLSASASHIHSSTTGKPPSIPRNVEVKQEPHIPVKPRPSVASKDVAELQRTFLAKLKEQELVQNYIDILTNQIKELKFVQSGVITFDALNTSSSAKPRAQSSTPPDQLDHINNVRDLDSFLAHLTTQSNVIHSVTKKFLGDSSKEGSHVQSQIKHYLDLKAGHKTSKASASQATESGNLLGSDLRHSISTESNISMDPPVKPQHTLERLFTSYEADSEEHRDARESNSFFTSSFLRPLNMNLFEQEDGLANVDIMNERDPLSGSMRSINKVQQGSMTDDLSENKNGSFDLKQLNAKGSKKIGCGFCSGDTPCLCFDADALFGEK